MWLCYIFVTQWECEGDTEDHRKANIISGYRGIRLILESRGSLSWHHP